MIFISVSELWRWTAFYHFKTWETSLGAFVLFSLMASFRHLNLILDFDTHIAAMETDM